MEKLLKTLSSFVGMTDVELAGFGDSTKDDFKSEDFAKLFNVKIKEKADAQTEIALKDIKSNHANVLEKAKAMALTEKEKELAKKHGVKEGKIDEMIEEISSLKVKTAVESVQVDWTKLSAKEIAAQKIVQDMLKEAEAPLKAEVEKVKGDFLAHIEGEKSKSHNDRVFNALIEKTMTMSPVLTSDKEKTRQIVARTIKTTFDPKLYKFEGEELVKLNEDGTVALNGNKRVVHEEDIKLTTLFDFDEQKQTSTSGGGNGAPLPTGGKVDFTNVKTMEQAYVLMESLQTVEEKQEVAAFIQTKGNTLV